MQLPFISKVPQNQYTALDVPKNSNKKDNIKKPVADINDLDDKVSIKLSIMFALSFVFFVAGLGFWIYVNFIMKT